MCLAMIRNSLCILVSTAILLAWSSATLHAQEPKRPDVNVMIHKLKDPSEGVRMQAAKTLGVLGAAAQSAVPALREAARTDPDEDVRRIAAAALQRIEAAIPDADAIQPLLKDLQNPDEGVRLKAAKTLGKMGAAARAAIPSLQKLAQHDPDADVRAVATRSLASITRTPTDPDPNAGGWRAFTPVGAGFTVHVPVDPVEIRLPGEVRYEFRFPNQKSDAKFGYVDLPVDEVRGKSPQEIMASLEKELSAEHKTKKLLSSQMGEQLLLGWEIRRHGVG